jgi:hypothetical protein
MGIAALNPSYELRAAASVARMSEATSGAASIDPACRCAHAGYLLRKARSHDGLFLLRKKP